MVCVSLPRLSVSLPSIESRWYKVLSFPCSPLLLSREMNPRDLSVLIDRFTCARETFPLAAMVVREGKQAPFRSENLQSARYTARSCGVSVGSSTTAHGTKQNPTSTAPAYSPSVGIPPLIKSGRVPAVRSQSPKGTNSFQSSIS